MAVAVQAEAWRDAKGNSIRQLPRHNWCGVVRCSGRREAPRGSQAPIKFRAHQKIFQTQITDLGRGRKS